MVDHPIIINVSIRTTNGMQLITCIYVRQNVLLKVKLLRHTVWQCNLTSTKTIRGAIDVYKVMADMHITRAAVISSTE